MSIADVAAILERAEEIEWPEPEPILAAEEDARPYPLDALPPVMRNAVETYQRYGQQPLALVACSALANASLAVQGLVDVGRDQNLIGPVSLNVAVIACSGERKTSADRRFAAAARCWQAERSKAMEPEMAAVRAAIDAHAAERDGIIAKIRRAAGKGSENNQADLAALRARLLLAWPISTMGMRRYREADLSAPELAAFDQRMHELLDLPLPIERPALRLRPEMLFLSHVARRQWIAFHDDVEQELGRDGAYGEVCDFAAKAAEKAARIAAVLHVFEHGPCGEVQVDALLAGAQIAAWHLHEARRIMAACERPQALSDADLLLHWLVQQEPQPVSLKRVSQYGPSRVRPRQRRDRAIEQLQERYLAVLDRFEGNTVLRLNPKLRGDREPA